MIIVGIDPGTHCGWAVLDDGKRLASGVWDLGARRHEGGGMRFVRLRKHLADLFDGFRRPLRGTGESEPMISAVAYEEVRRHMGVDAAHVYGGIVAVVQSVCEELRVPYMGMHVQHVKQLATGKGNAGKGAMIEAANRHFFPHKVADSNEADALFIALAADKQIGF